MTVQRRGFLSGLFAFAAAVGWRRAEAGDVFDADLDALPKAPCMPEIPAINSGAFLDFPPGTLKIVKAEPSKDGTGLTITFAYDPCCFGDDTTGLPVEKSE